MGGCCRICRALHLWQKVLTTPFQKRRCAKHAKALAAFLAMRQCQKRLGFWRHCPLPLGIPNYVRQLWYRHRKRVAGPRKPELLGCCLHLPAGITLRGVGWHSVCQLWRAGRGGLVPAGFFLIARFSSHALPATFIGGGVRLHARNPP